MLESGTPSQETVSTLAEEEEVRTDPDSLS